MSKWKRIENMKKSKARNEPLSSQANTQDGEYKEMEKKNILQEKSVCSLQNSRTNQILHRQ